MTIEQRFQRLERQNAKMKAAVAGMAVVLAVVLLVGAGQDKDKPKVLEEVRAKKFVLVDSTGKLRASWHVDTRDGQNGADLTLCDEDGETRLALRGSKREVGIVGYEKGFQQRFMLGATDDQGCGLKIYGLGGNAKVAAIGLGISESNTVRLGMIDKKGKSGADLQLAENGAVHFRLLDESGKVIFKAPE